MKHRRECGSCYHLHVFEREEDDRDECPRCGGELSPISRQIIEVEVETAIIQDEIAARVEEVLQSEGTALQIWQRVDDASPGQRIGTVDVAGQIAARLVDNLRPTIQLVSAARTFARAGLEHAARVTYYDAVAKATDELHHAAHALEYGCRRCGSLVSIDEKRRLCPDCATPPQNPEAEFDQRCRVALATFKGDSAKFNEATREIVKERPGITMVEFIKRATR